MKDQDSSKQYGRSGAGFPPQFIILLAIIVLGVLGLILKLVGFF